MSRKHKNNIDAIVNMAESEGLSYGKYVAQENAVHIERRPPVAETVKPRGISTIQAALRVDCPRLCEQAIHPKPPIPELPAKTQCESVQEDKTEVRRKRNTTGRNGLSSEKIVQIRSLRAQGETYSNIASKCNVSESSVKKYLKG